MRGLSGYATLVDPTTTIRERETFTCGHCGSVRHTEPFARGFLVLQKNGKHLMHEFVRCGHCDTLICEKCAGKGCVPFMKKLEMYERRMARRREYENG